VEGSGGKQSNPGPSCMNLAVVVSSRRCGPWVFKCVLQVLNHYLEFVLEPRGILTLDQAFIRISPFPTPIPQASCVPFVALIWLQRIGSHVVKCFSHSVDLEKILPHSGHATPTCPGKCDALRRASFLPCSVVHRGHPRTLQNRGVPAGSLRRLVGGLASTYARR